MKKLSKEEFIIRASEKYENKYDYSKSDYINSTTKICIICPKHGEFWMRPNMHILRTGCPKCGIESRQIKRSMGVDLFIERSKKIHGDKYDYSKVEYINNKTKVCIICPKHGEFWQTADGHIGKQKQGCPKCADYENAVKRQKPINVFIEQANAIHNNKYDYSKVEYINNRTKVCIICSEHGEFWQQPLNHLKGFGCSKCSGMYSDLKTFINKALKIHNKYDYSKVNYVNNQTKVCIICPEHGEFLQTPDAHINQKQGCPRCYGLNKTTEEWIKEAKNIHGNKYDYTKTIYVKNKQKVCIICPEHGEFLQAPNSHINKTKSQGCPYCNESHLETEIAQYLNFLNVKYERQKKFNWLGKQSLDFYLPEYNIAIECQGIQHFQPVNFFGGDKHLKYVQTLDESKKELCKEHDLKILYYANEKYNDLIFTNLNFLKEILC